MKTKTDLVREIMKCGQDPIYFLTEYARIQHPVRGLVPFRTYDYQNDAIRAFLEHRLNIVLKGRQLGFTTVIAGFIAWFIIFNRDKNVLIVSTKQDVAKNTIRIIRNIIKYIPREIMLCRIQIDNKQSIELSNGSRVKAITTSADAGRSEAVSLLFVDEVAHIDKMEELWTGIWPTISCLVPGTKILTEDGFCNIETYFTNRTAGEYFDLDGKIWGKHGLEKLSHGYVSPPSKTYKITTRSGKEIEVTYKHPLYALSDKGGKMVPAENLRIGDHLRVDLGMDVWGQATQLPSGDKLTENLAYALGVHQAIPEAIWKAPKHIVAAFLRGYFDADRNASRKSLQEVQLLLQNFGIVSSINCSGVRPSWHLTISPHYSNIFAKEIGFAITRKQNVIKCAGSSQDWASNIPLEPIRQTLLDIVSCKSGRWFREHGLRTDKLSKGKSTTLTWLRKLKDIAIANKFPLSDEQAHFLDEVTSQCYWDEIVNIEESFAEITYDFTVPGTHSFLQNGILGSNTGGRAILSSTPKGTGNFFYEMYKQAQNYENKFNCRFGTYVNPENPEEIYDDRFMWWVHPEHDRAWFEAETAGKSIRDISQEYLCVSAGTRILTRDGFKFAKDISVGDLVKTHKGRFRPVIKTYCRLLEPQETLYGISAPLIRGNEVMVTSNHPLWQAKITINAHKVQGRFSNLVANRYELDFTSLDDRKTKEYLNVLNVPLDPSVLTNELRVIDLLEFAPDLISEHDDKTVKYFRSHNRTARYISVDYDLGKLLGYYIAEGYITDDRVASFAFHSDEREHHAEIERLANKYGSLFRCDSRVPKANRCICVINDKFICRILKYFAPGNNCCVRKISDVVWETNLEFVRGLLEGVWFGDGLHNPAYKNILGLRNEQLIYQIRNLLSLFSLFPRVGRKQREHEVEPYLHYLEFNNVGARKIDELLRTNQATLEKSGSRTRLFDNKLWGNIQYQPVQNYDDHVYNFEVEEDNTYICDNLVVHNCNFNLSGDTFLQVEAINHLDSTTEPPAERTGDDHNLWIWRYPEAQGVYLIACDVSSGIAHDFSAFHVLRIDGLIEQVAEYKGKIPPDVLGHLLMRVSNKYNNAIIAPENNSGWSGQTILKITDANYPYLYYSPRRRDEFIDMYTAQYNTNAVAGYAVTNANRIAMLSKMEQYIRNKDIVIRSSRTVDEFRTFIWNAGRPQAARSAHDDLIMALAGAIWVREESFMAVYRNTDQTKALINAMTTSQTSVSQMRDFNFSENNFNGIRVKEYAENQNKIILNNGEQIDLNWLIGSG